jgi:HAD superfamily hydrolase (TIGR01490 family)
MSSRKAAFFDVDGTLIKGLLPCAFPDYLTRKGFFDKKKDNRIQELIRLYREGKLSYRYVSVRVPKLYAAGIKGQKHSEIMKLASTFMKEYSKNIFPYSKGLISLMNRNGFLTIVITSAPAETLPSLRSLGFKRLYGTEMHIRKGIYTGEMKRNLILAEEKKEVITSIIKKYHIDLKSSFAFGDSEQDLAMLSRVGNPVPLNPAPLLREYALKKGWCIPRDVIKEVRELVGRI